MQNPISLNLILREEVQRLLDNFAAVLNVRVVFFGMDGAILRCNTDSRNSDYCRLAQDRLFGVGRCLQMDAAKQKECLRRRSIVCYRCHAGLQEAIAPVMVESRLAGFIMIGQFRTSRRVPSAVSALCKDRKTRGKLEKSFLGLPYIEPKKLDDVLGLFVVLVDYIVTRELVGLKGDWIMEKIKHYLDLRATEPVKLSELAQFVGRSASTVSHLLQSKYGKTFKQMLIERRLELAENLFRTRPELTIGEVSGMVGFNDRFYFSRIYRKYRNISPRQSRGS
ncbi:MAG: hypothetical protein A2X49_06705 [Lentisphaerae bacterium GWF2_52_8]|nr:MAG: hypothetical protein A2X49_06705 [Lentisphaerae bacterium GWF2_52_8]